MRSRLWHLSGLTGILRFLVLSGIDFADIILDLISDSVWEAPESMRYKSAMWLLLESKRSH